jgi:hypothetical protein
MVPDDGSGVFQRTLLLYRDTADGFAVIVQEASEITFDMSAQFPISGDQSWYVWADVDYAVSNPTTGSYHVSDTVPPTDAVVFGKLNFTNGDTSIAAAKITEVLRSIPSPTKREDGAYVAGDEFYGLLSGEEAWNVPTSDQKRAMNSAPTAATASNPFVTQADTMDRYFGEPHFETKTGLSGESKVKITGHFYVGDTTWQNALKYFSLRRTSDKREQLYDTSNGERIWIASIKKSDDSGLVDPSTDADDEGFYENPYIYFYDDSGPYSYTGSLFVYCFRKKQLSSLEQAPVQAFPDAGIPFLPNAVDIMGKEVSGSPSSLAGNIVQGQISSIMGFVNDRIKTVHPDDSATSWKLVWRSSNIASDSLVTKDTISLYWMNGKFAILIGGYFNSATQVTSSVDNLENVVLHMWDRDDGGVGGELFAAKHSVAASTAWDWATRSNWRQWNVTPIKSSDSVAKVFELFSSSPVAVSDVMCDFVMGDLPDGYGWALCHNCGYNSGTLEWQCGSSSKDSMAFILTESKVTIAFKRLGTGAGDNNTPWVETEWTSKMEWDKATAGRFSAYPTLRGGAYDKVYVAMGGTIWSASHLVHAVTGASWHARLFNVDAGDVSTPTVLVSQKWNDGSVTVSNIDKYGCRIYGTDDGSGALGDSTWWCGHVVASFDD